MSRLRLATLSADMHCFARANPGAIFADFVRWYSPVNWVDGQQHRQHCGDGVDAEGGAAGERCGARRADSNHHLKPSSVVRDVVRACVARVAELAIDLATERPPAVSPTTATVATADANSVSSATDASLTLAAVGATINSDHAVTIDCDGVIGPRGDGEAGIVTTALARPPAVNVTGPGKAGADAGAGQVSPPDRAPPQALDAGAASLAARGGVLPVGVCNVLGGGEIEPLSDDAGSSCCSRRRGNGSGGGDGGGSEQRNRGVSSYSSSLESSSGVSLSCRLDWEGQGRIFWTPESATAARSKEGRHHHHNHEQHQDLDGLDAEEGAEWMEAWLEAENAVAEDGEDCGVRRLRPLFSPSQVHQNRVPSNDKGLRLE